MFYKRMFYMQVYERADEKERPRVFEIRFTCCVRYGSLFIAALRFELVVSL